jgi:hypothetical protein
MKQVLIISLLFIHFCSYGQVDSAKRLRPRINDSLQLQLQQDLGVNPIILRQVFFALGLSARQMSLNAKSHSITREEKLARFRQIAAARDSSIQKLLTSEQVIKLKAFVSAHRS